MPLQADGAGFRPAGSADEIPIASVAFRASELRGKKL
jgi:hypothetical protein